MSNVQLGDDWGAEHVSVCPCCGRSEPCPLCGQAEDPKCSSRADVIRMIALLMDMDLKATYALLMHDVIGKTQEEVAKDMGITKQAVSQKIKKLKRAWNKGFEHE